MGPPNQPKRGPAPEAPERAAARAELDARYSAALAEVKRAAAEGAGKEARCMHWKAENLTEKRRIPRRLSKYRGTAPKIA